VVGVVDAREVNALKDVMRQQLEVPFPFISSSPQIERADSVVFLLLLISNGLF
jgi:hypothetical protein